MTCSNIENHQPVRAIKDDVFSDRAAVNLKLKKDKLSRPVGTVSLGAGYAEEPVWLAEAFAMSAGAKQQFIAMYKTNNSAKDIASELNAQTLSTGSLEDVSRFSQKTLLNSHSFRSPPLEKKRHLFNNSHIGSVNSLWKTGEHSQFRLNVQYLHDVLEENSTRNSEYFLPEGTLRISEVSMLSRRTNTVDATATFINRRQSFGGNIQYRNPLTTFFFNTGLTYSPSRRNLVSSQRFVGTESVSGSRELKTNSNMLIWSAYAGKYFPDIRTNASLGVNYNNITGERQQQGVLYPLRSSVWAFMPKVNVKLSDASSVNFQTVASNRTTEITNAASSLKSTLWQVTQQLTAYYIIADKWQLNVRLEHSYNELTSDKSVDMLFADIGVSYKINQFEFDLSWDNLFNQKSYTYSIYNELDKFDYTYNLRPSMLMLTVSLRY